MRKQPKTKQASKDQKPFSVAIYTRKSTAKGLDDENNTLQFQREACTDFVNAKKGMGWVVYPESYDDGGFTGANTDRPSLQRLLADARKGKFQAIAVYKVDRISRSLRDLISMIEEFQKIGIEFISVSQSFDTSTPIGRLILNILGSFGQFERETIVERVKDKMGAARRKGHFTGGTPILGYDIHPQGRKLVINPEEADLVRGFFNLYLEKESIGEVVKELHDQGATTKKWKTKKGKTIGGVGISKSYLSSLLNNTTYRGKIEFQGETFDGEHEAIIDNHTFKRVQALLKENNPREKERRRGSLSVLLQDLLICKYSGEAMTHTYTSKAGKKYRYYHCSKYQREGVCGCKKRRIAATKIEQDIIGEIRDIGADDGFVASIAAAAREEHDLRVGTLFKEEAVLKAERKRLFAKVSYYQNKPEKVGDLAEIQGQLDGIDLRLNEIRMGLNQARKEAFDGEDFRKALAFFDPTWDALDFKDRRRLIQLLIGRIIFDGNEGKYGTCEIQFRNSGIQALAGEREI